MRSFKKIGILVLKTFFVYIAIFSVSSNLFIELMTIDLVDPWGVRNLFLTIFPYNITTFCLLFLAYLLMTSISQAPRKIEVYEKLFSVICSFAWIIGYSFHACNTWSLLVCRKLSIIVSSLTVIGLYHFLLAILYWLKKGYHIICDMEFPASRYIMQHTFLISWAAIFLCYIPYIVIRYPAGIEYDAYYQIEQFFGIIPMTSHWPPFSSAIMGAWVWLGFKLFHSYNIGIFLFVIFQSLICSAVFAYTILAMKRLHIRPFWQVISLTIYAVATIFPNYVTSAIKDTLYSTIVVLFTVLLAETLLLPPTKSRVIALGAVSTLMCLLRNNGIFVLGICTIVLGAYMLFRRNSLYTPVLVALLVGCVLNTGYSQLLPAIGIPSGSVAEALSIPFQQTARYVKTYPDDVTKEEAEIIDSVLDYDALSTLYDPNLSDPVKATYHGDTHALLAYAEVWIKQFIRHPTVYFAATLNNSCGYYYPFAQNLIFYSNTRSDDVMKYDEPACLATAKNHLYNYITLFESIPVLMLFSSCGFQSWIVLYLFLKMLFKKSNKKVLLLLPAIIGIGICIASPTYTVNGVRYALPIIYSIPFLIGLVLFQPESSERRH